MSSPRTRALVAGLASAALIAAGLSVAAPGASATPPSQTWEIPGAYDWVVPSGVTSVTIDAEGAAGAAGNHPDVAGGLGGSTTATLSVTPGETLRVTVGGAGLNDTTTNSNAGGFNGGGKGGGTPSSSPDHSHAGGGGGGASDVRRGGTTLADRVVVAGGGGGGGEFSTGGNGGGDGATAGSDSAGGGAGTALAGGAGGDTPIGDGAPGSQGLGGEGGYDFLGGGGGGGGWYGGGGGGAFEIFEVGGGGGGSGYADPAATGVTYANGVSSGDGSVTISWTPPAPTTTTTPPTTTPPTTTPPKVRPTPPSPEVTCPTPRPAFRVYGNLPSLTLAKYLMDVCAYTPRWPVVAGRWVIVIDPPGGTGCTNWRPFRIQPTQLSQAIGWYLISKCAYSIHFQRDGHGIGVYIVPSGWPPGARVTAA